MKEDTGVKFAIVNGPQFLAVSYSGSDIVRINQETAVSLFRQAVVKLQPAGNCATMPPARVLNTRADARDSLILISLEMGNLTDPLSYRTQ